jgi:hypothetical protein
MGSGATLAFRLKTYAHGIGFDLVRIASAEPFAEAERVILERIERGLLRGLDWFTADRARFSADPRRHLPTARSIVSLGMSYLGDERSTDSAETGPSPQPSPTGLIVIRIMTDSRVGQVERKGGQDARRRGDSQPPCR